jgi:hypothetical protein
MIDFIWLGNEQFCMINWYVIRTNNKHLCLFMLSKF